MKRILLLLAPIILFACNQENNNAKTNDDLYDYDIEECLDSLGITLTEPTLPKGVKIVLATKVNNLIYLSGNGPVAPDGTRTVGKLVQALL